MAPTSEPGAWRPTRVWDLPTRLFHWILAASVISSLVTGQIAGNALQWHMRLGYLAFGLLAFRLLWGLVGGRWSRFASFVYAPGTTMRYLRGQSRADEHLDVGHNPLGSFSVFALLAVLCVQVATGLVADDEIATTGPLNKFVSNATGLAATGWHKHFGYKIIVVLLLLHVGAIVYYRLKKKINLVRPMLSGDKHLPASVPASADTLRTRALAAVLAALCAALVTWVVRSGA